MKISIITVCYNSANTIGHTLRSVHEQTHGDIEHIIVDGESKDNTLAVVISEGAHVAKLVSEKDNGIYDAMNKGIQMATGDVVAFLNADDFYKDANVLALVAQVMQAEQLDALYGDVEFFRPGQQDIVVRRYNSGRFTAGRLGRGWMPAHPALFVRRTLFERYGAFRTDYRIAGDFEFIARVFRHPELRHRHLPKSLVRMQLGGISTSGWRATLQLNREMMRACRANAIPTNWLKMLLRYPFKAWEFFRTSE
ncbi:MAG: glycosyltransferase family 2 protein [Cellvibrio sp.]|uniref:glycosyltransferase family 2 protein n=1 Tax=Cellvibrio sp. TaxID=1965322 RepID=UPI00272001B1|nr:glycosyltransferase family 2 protein [Cellvibrio sp.]